MVDKKWFVIAEQIVRREYEKCYDTDISKPVGRIYTFHSIKDEMEFMNGVVNFWHELGIKYDRQYNKEDCQIFSEEWQKLHPLYCALSTLCLNAKQMMELKTLQTHDEYVKNKN